MTKAEGSREVDGLTAAVRQRLGPGRLLPLGGPADGAWIAERAAAAVLRGAATGSGAVLGRIRLGPADADGAQDAAVPAPPSALAPGPLRIEAEFSATLSRPLPATAQALRSALLATASQRLGLVIAEVDLRVTELLDAVPDERPAPPAERAAEPASQGVAAIAGEAASGVPGVASLTQVLGGAVHIGADHVRVELATAGDHRALDVALAVRAAVGRALEGHPPVAVLVTAVVDGHG